MAKPNRGMLEGPLLPAIVSYAIPIIFTSLLQLLVNAADLVVLDDDLRVTGVLHRGTWVDGV